MPQYTMMKFIKVTVESRSLIAGYEQQKYLHFVHDAVFAFAHALTTMQSDLCGDSWIGMCEEMEPDQIDGETLLAHLEDVNFIGQCTSSSVFI